MPTDTDAALDDLLDAPLDTAPGGLALRDASAADLRIAVHLTADALASTIGRMSHFDLPPEALDELGEHACALLARIEVLELAQAWGAARAADAEDRWREFLADARVA